MAELLPPEEKNRYLEVLKGSRDSGMLAAAASALAESEDPQGVLALADFLGRAEFLNRLDDTANNASYMRNLTVVFRALAEHPTETTARLCELVYAEDAFREKPGRLNLLLAALAAVRPVTANAADIFRTTSQQDFAEVNGPLLLQNGSQMALRVFEEIITFDWVEAYVKVDILHRAVLPMRTRLPVIEMCERILLEELDGEVRTGVLETLFDERSRLWFGPAIGAPMAPVWESAGTEALEYLLKIAERALAAGVEEPLRGAVEATRQEIEGIVLSRRE